MTEETARVVLVVPCFNEGERLQPTAFLHSLASQPDLSLCFVDDGSEDDSWAVLEEIRGQEPERIVTLKMDRNRGKAEAVRRGVLHFLHGGDETESSPEFLGYWDADLSTPLTALPLFLETFSAEPDARLVMGARVQLLGRTIIRRPARHYLGRAFSTLASLALDLPVYDTQCGAKLFRVDSEIKETFARPFSDSWIFDVEILARLTTRWGSETRSRVIELPLPSWEHKGGSKIRPWHGLQALLGLFSIWLHRVRKTQGGE